MCGSLCPDLRRSGVWSGLRSGVCRSCVDLLPAARSVLRAGQLLQAPVQAVPAEVPSAEAAPLLPSEVPHALLQCRSGLLRPGRSLRSGLLCPGRSDVLRSDLRRSDELLPLVDATLVTMLVVASRPD